MVDLKLTAFEQSERELRLYYSPNSCALAFIVLEEVGADYSPELIDFTKSEQNQADYLKINPKHGPALQTVDGIII